MKLGFSYVGLIYLAMLFIPNIIWSKNLPEDYEKYVVRENKALRAMERIGEVLVSCAALIFADFNIGAWSGRSWWLVLSFAAMILYEAYWIRYFRSEKTMKDFYADILGIPVAGATLPVIAFFLLGVYGRNPCMMIAVVLLGIGHIGIHVGHKKEL